MQCDFSGQKFKYSVWNPWKTIFNAQDYISHFYSEQRKCSKNGNVSFSRTVKCEPLTERNLSRHNKKIKTEQNEHKEPIDVICLPKEEENEENHVSDNSEEPKTAPGVREEIHIEQRKCKHRKCGVCKPKVKNYHNLQRQVDPVLFTRWEKKRKKNNGVGLQKVDYLVNGLGQVVRCVDVSVEGKVKEASKVIKSKVKIRLDTLRGQKVIARRDQDGLYYPAVVLKCVDTRHAKVRYECEKDDANILTRNLIPMGGAVARPPLYVGDYVLIRVVYLDTKEECYVPAMIQAEPKRESANHKFFTVLMYNGQKATTMRKHLVKISKERFELASMYIADQQNEDREEAQNLLYVSATLKHKVKKRPNDMRKHERKRSPLSISSRGSSADDIIEEIDEEETDEKGSRERDRKQKKREKSSSRSRSRSSSRDRSRSRSRSVSRDRKRSRSRSSSRSSRSSSSRDSRKKSGSGKKGPALEKDRKSKKETNGRQSRQDEGGRKDPDEQDDDFYEDRSPSPNEGSTGKGQESGSARASHDEPGSSRSNKERELERLQQELIDQQKKQEREKRKLKRKAKYLSRRKKDIKKSILRELTEEKTEEADGNIPEREDPSVLNPSLIELRKQLHHLRPGEEILARWQDDGWYYRGIIRHYHGDYSYDVEDSTGFVERIWRDDLISEHDSSEKVFELDNKVIALHPDYSFSYAPGIVTEVNDSELGIEFYDGSVTLLPWGEVYHYHDNTIKLQAPQDIKEELMIPNGDAGGALPGGGLEGNKEKSNVCFSNKFMLDVAYIIKQEKKLVGAAVVARDDRTGAYYPGTVTKRIDDNSRSYTIRWADGSTSSQNSIHIFSAFTRRPNLSFGDRVLACVDRVHVKFLPGHVQGPGHDGNLVVTFCNSEIQEDVDPALCYWLGQQYFSAAVKYFKSHDPSYS